MANNPLRTTPMALFTQAARTAADTNARQDMIGLRQLSMADDFKRQNAADANNFAQTVDMLAGEIQAANPGMSEDEVFEAVHQQRPDLVSAGAKMGQVFENGFRANPKGHRQVVGFQQELDESGNPTGNFVPVMANAKTGTTGPATVNQSADPDDVVIRQSGGATLRQLRDMARGNALAHGQVDLGAQTAAGKTMNDAYVGQQDEYADGVSNALTEQMRVDRAAGIDRTRTMQSAVAGQYNDQRQALSRARQQQAAQAQQQQQPRGGAHLTAQPEAATARISQRLQELYARRQQLQDEGIPFESPEAQAVEGEIQQIEQSADNLAGGLRQQEEGPTFDDEMAELERDYNESGPLGKAFTAIKALGKAHAHGVAEEFKRHGRALLSWVDDDETRKADMSDPEGMPVRMAYELGNDRVPDGQRRVAAQAYTAQHPAFQAAPAAVKPVMLRVSAEALSGQPTESQIKARGNTIRRTMKTAAPRTEQQIRSAMFLNQAGALSDRELSQFVSGEPVSSPRVDKGLLTFGKDGNLYDLAKGMKVSGGSSSAEKREAAMKLREQMTEEQRELAATALAARDPKQWSTMKSDEREAAVDAAVGLALQGNPMYRDLWGIDLDNPNNSRGVQMGIMDLAAETFYRNKFHREPNWWDKLWGDDQGRPRSVMQMYQIRDLEREARRGR